MGRKELSQKILKECFHYNEDSGDLTWIERPLSHFSRAQDRMSFNNKYTGKKIKCVDTSGYLVVGVHYKIHRVHRLIFMYMNGEIPNLVDHINGDKLDNSWNNLRSATKSENSKNSFISRANTSGYTGVYFCNTNKNWVAQISINGKTKNIGRFTTPSEAANARASLYEGNEYSKRHGEERASEAL